MATWNEFARDAADLAEAGRALWEGHMLMYLATVRSDGSPRVHPVTPVLAGGQVFVAVGPRSPKWRDLLADPRCVLHGLPGSRDDELVLRCRGREVPAARERVRAAAAHTIHDDDHIFAFDIEQVDHGWWDKIGQPDTYPIRRRWTPMTGVTAVDTGRWRPAHER